MNKNLIVLSGGLYPAAMGYNRVIRPVYQRTFSRITNSIELRATIRNGEFAWPGGYQMYLITADSDALCFDCAQKEYQSLARGMRDHDKSWTVIGCDINYEDNDLYCGHCQDLIPAAYGEAL